MTTVVAVKKGKHLCLATDTLASFGNRKEIAERHVEQEGKWIQVGQNYIGISGHTSWKRIISHYFSTQKTIVWKTPDQIFEIFSQLHLHLKEQYFLTPPSLRYLPFESSEFQLLIVNRHGIFEVEHSRAVRQYSQYSAIGSGEEYALGAMRAIYNQCDDAKEIARIGIEAAAEFDCKTGLPIQILCPTLI